MKTTRLIQFISLLLLTGFGVSAWGVPSASSPYVTDPQHEYVQDATSDAIGSVNMVLCILNSMNINGSGMLNVGPYIALIDMNKCDSHGANNSSGGASGASAATNYLTAIVDASRASNADPMVANIWMSMTEQGHTTNVYVKASATQSPADVPPYGVFRMDYIGYANSVMQFNGFINSTPGGLLFYETGNNSSNIAMSMTASSTTAGSGTMTVGVSPVTTFNFNYDPNYFRRSDGTNDQCFDRLKANADRSVWRLGTYNANDGSRVDQANPSFQIIAAYGGHSYYGNAGYYGLNFQGLDLNTIADASPISGLVVTDQRPGNSTTYGLSKVGGKLTKWTQHNTTLSAMNGIPFNFNGDLTGKTTGNGTVTGWGNWQMQWNNTNANFTVTGMQTCSNNGCTLATLSPVATVNSGALNDIAISGWSDSFGGSINIPSSSSDHVAADSVSYYSQTMIIPGSGSAPSALYCLNNCPDSGSVSAAQGYTTGTPPSPFGGSTASQWYSAPDSAHTVSYSFDAGGLKNNSAAMIINNSAFYNASPMFAHGVMTGRLFDAPLTFCSGSSGPVCEPSAPAVYYSWSTGPDQWNQSMWLTNGSSVVAFDPPQNIAYTVPSGAAYGSWAGKSIQLQFNGFGNLYGIPGHCVNPIDNSPTDCSTPNVRYVPAFSIPDGATMTLGSTPLIVKALDAEIRLNNLGAGAAQCSSMSLAPLTPPSGGTHDMSSSSDAFYIGVKPTITSNPKVIDGIVQ